MTAQGEVANQCTAAWLDSRAFGTILVMLYVVIAVLPLIIVLLSGGGGDPVLEEIGKGAALVGFTILVLQVTLTSRIRTITRPFGLDGTTLFHEKMALVGTALLISHPILLSLGEGDLHLFYLDTPWQVWVGKITLLFLIFAVLFALYFYKLSIGFQTWRVMHKGIILVVVLGATHALFVGSDLALPAPKTLFWILLLAALGIFIYRNVYIPLWGRNRFRVADVSQETHDTYTLRMEPRNNGLFSYRPGQFMFLSLRRPGRKSEEHPFTISSSPTEREFIKATIKESGDFTNTIGETREDDGAEIEAPFGRFSLCFFWPRKFVFIAGGVGITPIRSMLKYLEDIADTRPVTLIYANRSREDIIFEEELNEFSQRIKIVYVLEEAGEEWTGERGYVTGEMIQKHAGEDLSEADFFVCGPPPMMHKVISELQTLGVGEERIHNEYFSI